MSCNNKIISVGKTNKFLFLILVGGVLSISLILVENFSKSFTEQKKHPVIYTFTYSIGLSLSFILLIIYKIRNKRNNKNLNSLLFNKTSKTDAITIKTVFTPSKQITKTQKLLWIFLISVINYFAYILLCVFWINLDNYLNTWGFNLIVMSVFSYFLLKIKLYRHHYLAIIFIIIFGFLYNTVTGRFTAEKFEQYYISYIVQFVNAFLIFLINVMYKYLMDIKFINSYEILFIEGIIEFILGIITLVITTSIGELDNFFDFIEEIDANEIIIFIALTVMQFLLYAIEMVIIEKFSPFHILLIYMLKDFIIFFVYLDAEQLGAVIYITFSILISLAMIMILVFTEIIEINILGLSTMTKKNIESRAQFDIYGSNDDNKSEIDVNVGGYILDMNDGKVVELKHMDSSFSSRENSMY